MPRARIEVSLAKYFGLCAVLNFQFKPYSLVICVPFIQVDINFAKSIAFFLFTNYWKTK